MYSISATLFKPLISVNKINQAPVGKHNHIPDDEFDPKQLEMGIQVEFEHTDDISIAKAVTKDHLVEIPDYYIRLKEMEDKAKIELYNKLGNKE
jgi:inner membrane protein involved in colicin E2 resistance